MRKYIPTLQELQAFEATARHLSFTRAGKELHVTQSAVSHHVSKLEGLLGTRLFERGLPRLILTEAGQAYFERIEPLLSQLEAATVEMLAFGARGGTLNVACPTTFGVNWLIPRLPDFNKSCRNVNLTLARYPKLDGPSWDPSLDAAIRFGDGNWPGLISQYLMGKEMVVICHPDDLKGQTAITRPSDLERFTLLQHEGDPLAWERWFEHVGATHPSPYVGPKFDPFSMIIKAVAARIGVALVPRCIIDPELKSGQISIAFDQIFDSTQGYYLTYPERRKGSAPIEALRQWIHDAAISQAKEW
jgi:DNA-binding transcriptional LysR family regulator